VLRIPSLNHQDAIRALQKAGFGSSGRAHIMMTDGIRIITIPRHNPVNAFTMGGIVHDAGLSEEDFLALLVCSHSFRVKPSALCAAAYPRRYAYQSRPWRARS
jgi:hypothetical protein